jgi:flavin reductase (DIM6/NTAB) family NADH-FMN oxidoreductase RutF
MTHSQPTAQNPTAATTDSGATEAVIGTALGRIPSGLFVITWRDGSGGDGGYDRGMLASWVMQAGFAPPLVSVAVGVSRDLLAAAEKGVPFVVNVLGESQRSLAGRFGKPGGAGDDPFAGLALERTATGTAALADAVAWLECLSAGTVHGGEPGDHRLLLGRVTSARCGSDLPPLVHLRRNGLRY